MTFWELLIIVLSAAALMVSILWAFVAYAVRKNRQANEELLRAMKEGMTHDTHVSAARRK